MKVSTLKPGMLVSVKTTIRGGVKYTRTDIEPEHAVGEGRSAEWNTKRDVADAEEFERAIKIRSAARALITAICSPSSFGLLCPQDREQELSDAVIAAVDMVREFNSESRASKVEIFSIAGRIAQDDIQAARAIASEIRDLMRDMESGIKRADPEAIRKAANAAKQLKGMLSADVADKVSGAIEQARKAAREIVKRIGNAGEVAADVVAEINVSLIKSAQFAFLDLDEDNEVEPMQAVSSAVEFDDAPAYAIAASPVEQSAIEF
jgi:hypothetical protein